MAYKEEAVKAKNSGPKHRRSAVVGSNKVIMMLGEGAEYYDLARDPGEKRPDALSQGTRTKLERALASAGAPSGDAVVRGDVQPFDQEQKERLRALGYVE
jgi:hypothetical protein